MLEKNWHVTLLFLGEIPEESLKDWASEMTNGLTDFSPFQVEVKEIALFPTPAKAGYIVATVEASPKLLAVKAAIDQVAGRLNVEVETRPFRPHITLARGKRQQPLSSTILPLEAGFSFWVNRITLYESQLMKSGAVYQSRIEQRLTINC